MDVLIEVSSLDNLRAGRHVSKWDALKDVANLKLAVVLIVGIEYLRCRCFWSIHLIDQSPALTVQGSLQDILNAPDCKLM